MGLDELNGMGIDDNKGGRPSKDELENSSRQVVQGDPFTPDKDDEDWWYQKYTKYKMEADNTAEIITLIADHVFVNPIEVRKKLHDYDILETDWSEYQEMYPRYDNDARIPGNELNSTGTAGMGSRIDDVFSGSSSSSNDDDGPSDGLASLM